jgi:hypothetical protein
MKLGRKMDYHGSRAYAPDVPSAPAGSWVRRHAGPLAIWATHMLEMLLKPGARQAAETIWLVDGKERNFSLLGSNRYASKRRGAAAACPFPEGEGRVRRPIGDRADAA